MLRANFGLLLGQRGLAFEFVLLGLGLGGLCALPLDLVHLGTDGLCLGFEFGEAPLDFVLVGHDKREHDALLFVNLGLVGTLLQRHVDVAEEGLVRVDVHMRVPEVVADADHDVLARDTKGLTRALVEALLVRRRKSISARHSFVGKVRADLVDLRERQFARVAVAAVHRRRTARVVLHLEDIVGVSAEGLARRRHRHRRSRVAWFRLVSRMMWCRDRDAVDRVRLRAQPAVSSEDEPKPSVKVAHLLLLAC